MHPVRHNDNTEAIVSRRYWYCQNRECTGRHATVLGTLTAGGDLVLDRAVVGFRIFLDTRRVVVACPTCGACREFRGGSVYSAKGREIRASDRAGKVPVIECGRQN